MDKKFEQLTVMDAFLLGKVMNNHKIAVRLLGKLMGQKIHHIEGSGNNICHRKDGKKGIRLILHMADEVRSVMEVRLYLCDEDMFGKNGGVYCFVCRCNEAEVTLKDEAMHIFVCASKELSDEGLDKDIIDFIGYMKSGNPGKNNFTKMIDDEVRRLRRNSAFRKEYEALQRAETERMQKEFAERYKNMNF